MNEQNTGLSALVAELETNGKWPAEYRVAPSNMLVAHAFDWEIYGGSSATGEEHVEPDDDIVAYFVSEDVQNPVWPWNPAKRRMATAKPPTVIGITHAALMEHFNEGYSIIMDESAAQAVKSRHASDEVYDEYEVIFTPTQVEGSVKVSFQYKDYLEWEKEQALAGNPSADEA